MMKIQQVLDHNPALGFVEGPSEEFFEVGPVDLDALGLLTYAVDREFVVRAMGNHKVVALFCRPEDVRAEEAGGVALFLTDEPCVDFFRFHNWLAQATDFYYNKFIMSVMPDDIRQALSEMQGIRIDKMRVRIDRGTNIGFNAVLQEGTKIRNFVTIGPGCVLGQAGARFVTSKNGDVIPVLHAGGVLVETGATIGANCVIVRSVWREPTTIGRRAFIGNLVNIGHNCHVGEGAIVLPGAVLCGGVKVGAGAHIGPGAIIRNQARIGEGARVSMGAVVTQDVPPGARVSGNWAIPHRRFVNHVKQAARPDVDLGLDSVVMTMYCPDCEDQTPCHTPNTSHTNAPESVEAMGAE